MLQCTQPNVNKPKSLLWGAKPLKTKFLCEHQERVSSGKAGLARSFGPTFGAFCFLKTEEEASSTLVWSRDQNDKKHAEHQANVRHFELSWKYRVSRMRARECMSHRVYNL